MATSREKFKNIYRHLELGGEKERAQQLYDHFLSRERSESDAEEPVHTVDANFLLGSSSHRNSAFSEHGSFHSSSISPGMARRWSVMDVGHSRGSGGLKRFHTDTGEDKGADASALLPFQTISQDRDAAGDDPNNFTTLDPADEEFLSKVVDSGIRHDDTRKAGGGRVSMSLKKLAASTNPTSSFIVASRRNGAVKKGVSARLRDFLCGCRSSRAVVPIDATTKSPRSLPSARSAHGSAIFQQPLVESGQVPQGFKECCSLRRRCQCLCRGCAHTGKLLLLLLLVLCAVPYLLTLLAVPGACDGYFLLSVIAAVRSAANLWVPNCTPRSFAHRRGGEWRNEWLCQSGHGHGGCMWLFLDAKPRGRVCLI